MTELTNFKDGNEKEYIITDRVILIYYTNSEASSKHIAGSTMRKIRKNLKELFIHDNAKNVLIKVHKQKAGLYSKIYINDKLIRYSSTLNNYNDLVAFCKKVFKDYNYIENYIEKINDEKKAGIFSHDNCFYAYPDSHLFIVLYKSNYDGKTDNAIIGALLSLSLKDHFNEQHVLEISRRGKSNKADISVYNVHTRITNIYTISGINGLDLCDNIMYHITNLEEKINDKL